jgi:dienelactone hydrolase
MTKLVFVLAACAAFAQRRSMSNDYQEVYYPSGKLRLEAYLYKPAGNGPFPVVIYNHGSRPGREKTSAPLVYIGKMLMDARYVVLVPERRGYGRSDGATFSEEIGSDHGAKFVARMEEETADVLAGVEYLKTLPYADRSRVAVMGWSLGGIVTVFAAARSSAFRAAINQAGASLTWDTSPAMQNAMTDAAGRIRIPMLAMVAKNDRTTHAVEAVAQEMKSHHAPVKLIVYPAYTPLNALPGTPGGHLIFAGPGMKLWRGDVLAFLAENLAK